MNCVHCGEPITQSGRGRPRKYCGDRCQRQAQYRPAEPHIASCSDCGESFTRSNRNRKICDDCRAEKARAKDRARVRDWSHKKQCPCRNCGALTWGKPTDEVTCHPCRRRLGPPIYSLELLAALHAVDAGMKEWTGKTALGGLGHRHQQAVRTLMSLHEDGSPCDWCGRPMWLDPKKNWDYEPGARRPGNGKLQGDHSIPRKHYLAAGEPVPLPDRLLHGKCNNLRGDGGNDHLAWANRGVHVEG